MIFIHNIDIASNDVVKSNKQSLPELISIYENILQDNKMLYTSTKNAIAWLKSSPYIDTHMHTAFLLHGDYKMDNIFTILEPIFIFDQNLLISMILIP